MHLQTSFICLVSLHSVCPNYCCQTQHLKRTALIMRLPLKIFRSSFIVYFIKDNLFFLKNIPLPYLEFSLFLKLL